MNTIENLIHFAVTQFKQNKLYFGHGADNALDEAVYLVLSALHLPPDSDQKILARKLTDEEKKKVTDLIDDRIKKRTPVPYLTNEAWFCGLPFYVDERVLIPRSPIAELIEARFSPWVDPEKVTRILDVGTGSGCIAISLAYAFPDAKIDAIDLSDDALDVAKINCEKHQVTNRVRLLKSDLFAGLTDEAYDIIVANPPYVGSQEMEELPKEYYHEPGEALLAGKNGDEIVARIIKNAAKHLSPKGVLVVEVGNSAPLIVEKYKDLPFVWLEFEHGEGEVFLLQKYGVRSRQWTTR